MGMPSRKFGLTGRTGILVLGLVPCLAPAVFAQESVSYQIKEHTVNAGGVPVEGVVLASASYQMTLGAVGDGVAAPQAGSASYEMGAGFVMPYPPPREVRNLRFTDTQTMEWDAESSTGTYTLFRGDIAALGGGYGACQQTGLTEPGATEGAQPPGSAFFYIVAAENLLNEQGSLGTDSTGTPRAGASCP